MISNIHLEGTAIYPAILALIHTPDPREEYLAAAFAELRHPNFPLQPDRDRHRQPALRPQQRAGIVPQHAPR